MLIRKATIEDIDELIKLRIEFMSEMNKKAEVPQNLENELKIYFKEHISNNTFVAWLAIVDDKIVATSGVCFYTVPPTFKNVAGKNAYIMNVYTREGYRKRGVAAKLFEKTIEEARSNGSKKIHLSATKDGAPLYEKFNFQYNPGEMEFYLI